MQAKGYTFKEGVNAVGLSISSFRRYEKENHLHHNDLIEWIDELPNKNNKG